MTQEKIYSEHHIHIGVAHYFREISGKLNTFEFWHTYNGGKREPEEARLLKLKGVLPGVLDFIFIGEHKAIVFIEIKKMGVSVSGGQVSFIEKLIKFNFPHYVVRAPNKEQAIEAIKSILLENNFRISVD